MKYTVSKMKKMNSIRLANLVRRVAKSPKSQRTELTLRRANKILESRAYYV